MIEAIQGMGIMHSNDKFSIRDAVAPQNIESPQTQSELAPVGTSQNPSHDVFTVANFITFCRFILTIVFLVLFVQHDASLRTPALVCYAIAACTDFLDGQVARRTQTVSWVGKIMDPIMDRVLLFTGVLGLMIAGELPVWIAVFVITRDVVLGLGAMVLQKYQTRPLDVIYVGKAATALLMSGFVDLLIGAPVFSGPGLVDMSWLPGFNGNPFVGGMYLVYVGIICSVIAAVDYFSKDLAIRRRVIEERKRVAAQS